MCPSIENIKTIQGVYHLLSWRRFPLGDEKILQQQVHDLFVSTGLVPDVDFAREYKLTTKDIPDFYFPAQGFAIEIKIKGSARMIHSQCLRYCQHKDVKSLLLLTNKAMGLPAELLGKPCYFLNLGKAWL